jgi:hypothetical protein
LSAATWRVEGLELLCACGWCGMTTPLGVTCESCGSPLEALRRCRYCKKMATEPVCARCQDVLVRLWTMAQGAPESRFLFADVL